MLILILPVCSVSKEKTFYQHIAFGLHYLLKDLKETTLHHFLFVSLHQIRVKCVLVTQCRT